MTRTVLIPLDGSRLAERAVPYAAHLAEAPHARLLLLHAATDLHMATHLQEELEVSVSLDHLVERLRRRGLDATSRIVHEPPADAIVDVARTEPVDAIVMSTHGRSGIGRWLYGSIADDVLRRATVPVLLISAACDHHWPLDRPLRVLVPLDGSLMSEAALAPAREFATSLGAEILLVRAIEEPMQDTYRYDAAGLPIRIPAGEVELLEARHYLEWIRDGHRLACPSADVFADTGEASSVIAEAAARGDADLIVMATHGRTGLERLAMGSVATRVLQRVRVPVLLVSRTYRPRPHEHIADPARSMSGPEGRADTPAPAAPAAN